MDEILFKDDEMYWTLLLGSNDLSVSWDSTFDCINEKEGFGVKCEPVLNVFSSTGALMGIKLSFSLFLFKSVSEWNDWLSFNFVFVKLSFELEFLIVES